MRRILVAGVVAAVAVAGAATAIRLSPGAAAGVEVGDRIPSFRAPDLTGKEVAFSDHLGDVVLINVWATWCGPCRVEMPPIQSLYDRFGDRGFVVLAVSIDAGASHKEKVERFVEEYGLTFPVLLDPEGGIQRLLRTIGVPETFVLDREGRIVKRLIGAADWDSEPNQALIEELLSM